MRLREKRWTALARESNHYGEQAARFLLDGHYKIAVDAGDRAIRAAGRLHRSDKGDRDVIEVLADHLRNRAETQALWVRTPGMWNTARATPLIKDATRALGLFEALAPDAKYPVRPAEASGAAEALLAWQDVAEGYAGLIEHSPSPIGPIWSTFYAMARQAEWLQAVDEPKLADAYLAATASMADGRWHELVTRLRAPLEKVVERLVTEQGTHQ
ncbi:hypothetical protein Psi02_64730 [Planotetraspora silvatica]|uniref:Uncharacterized protein n=1 Tax=Planotetraspora silvatica TaxID=234614 RepID=A0A8J3UQI2_9ACTN|nr:hypothetical protein [Planotetraspora silvatica]GII50049.1 hypothetical protein Psi02_64730 [Planotetraspora silvatica]